MNLTIVEFKDKITIREDIKEKIYESYHSGI